MADAGFATRPKPTALDHQGRSQTGITGDSSGTDSDQGGLVKQLQTATNTSLAMGVRIPPPAVGSRKAPGHRAPNVRFAESGAR